METSYQDEAVDRILNPGDYIGPERQLVAPATIPVAAARKPLPAPPPAPAVIARMLPPGFTYLGPRDDERLGQVFEAQHKLGVAFAPDVAALVALCGVVATELAAGGACERVSGFNRRRKRRARRDKDLMRCGFGTCSAVVWPDQMSDHLKACHPHAAQAPLSQIYTRPAHVEDDGTGDDLTLDDPALARRVQAED